MRGARIKYLIWRGTKIRVMDYSKEGGGGGGGVGGGGGGGGGGEEISKGRAKSVHDTNAQFIKVNREIHESKGVNIVFDILHIGCNGSITLLRASKILAMNHDPSS